MVSGRSPGPVHKTSDRRLSQVSRNVAFVLATKNDILEQIPLDRPKRRLHGTDLSEFKHSIEAGGPTELARTNSGKNSLRSASNFLMNCLPVGYNCPHQEARPGVDYKALSPAELVLHSLRTGEESAWIEFVRRFHPLIASVVVRIGRQCGESSREVFDDLVQETYLKLCADREILLQSFQAGHPDAIFGFIKVFTANLVRDHFKAVYSLKRGGGTKTEPTDDQTPNPISVTFCSSDAKSIERAVLFRQIDACLRDAESGPNAGRDRRIFWLYYRVGLPASEIAALPSIGLSTKGVESTLLRLNRQIRDRLVNNRQVVPGWRETEKREPLG